MSRASLTGNIASTFSNEANAITGASNNIWNAVGNIAQGVNFFSPAEGADSFEEAKMAAFYRLILHRWTLAGSVSWGSSIEQGQDQAFIKDTLASWMLTT